MSKSHFIVGSKLASAAVLDFACISPYSRLDRQAPPACTPSCHFEHVFAFGGALLS
jgi:hypothetical protein